MCSIEGCDRKPVGGGLCHKHYMQKRRGGILARSIYDDNEIIERDGYAVIRLYNRAGEHVASSKIDLEDVPRVRKHKWYFDAKTGYVASNTGGWLHRFVMRARKGYEVDHRKQNAKTDNRKLNLRLATRTQNALNRGLQMNNTSGAKGVTRARGKWQAQIKHEGRNIYLGVFDSFEQAVAVRDAKALELHDQRFAILNRKVSNRASGHRV